LASPRPGARIAQLVEQRIENPRVGGSNPSPGTINFKRLADILRDAQKFSQHTSQHSCSVHCSVTANFSGRDT
jgi:hypothetical protein